MAKKKQRKPDRSAKTRKNLARNKVKRIKKALEKATGSAIEQLTERLKFWGKQV